MGIGKQRNCTIKMAMVLFAVNMILSTPVAKATKNHVAVLLFSQTSVLHVNLIFHTQSYSRYTIIIIL